MESPLRGYDTTGPLVFDGRRGGHSLSKGRPIEIVALVPYPPDTTPSQRFRIEQWRGPLEELGIRVRLAPFADRRLMKLLYEPGRSAHKIAGMIAGVARRLGDVATAGRGDAILVHRAVVGRAGAAGAPLDGVA